VRARERERVREREPERESARERVSERERETETFLMSIEEPSPTRGAFLVGWFPNQQPGGRGPPLKNNPEN